MNIKKPVIVEFDGDGHAENELAQIWLDSKPGERNRVAGAAGDVENALVDNPNVGRLVTNGAVPVVRYLDLDLLRASYRVDEQTDKIIVTIFGFKKVP